MATKLRVIVVSAVVDGFRRAGRAFTKASQEIAKHELTPAQIKAINDEPMLSVKEATIEVEDDDPRLPQKDDGKTDPAPPAS